MKTPFPAAALLTALALASASPARAAMSSITANWTGNVTIPDNNRSGVSEDVGISTAISSITAVTVTLNIAGPSPYDGDFYAYLTSSSGGFAVLLNRIGVNSSRPYGSAATGLNVTFSATGANGDIHYAPENGTAITGNWQPDGLTVSPLGPASAYNGATPSALLNSFNGLNPNGTWTLFVADLSPGGVGALEGWSVTIDGNVAAVPELPTAWAGLLALPLLFLRPALRPRPHTPRP